MSGRKSQGVNFDDLFDPDIVGDGPSASGYNSNGVAIRYAALAYGTKRPDVGYRRNGVDVSNLWAAKGTAVYVIADVLPPLIEVFQSSTSGPVTATVSFTFNRNGTATWTGGPLANWIVAPTSTSGDAYDQRFTVTASSPANPNVVLTGPIGTWVQMNASVTVSLAVTQTTSGDRTGTRTILREVRRRSDNAIVASEYVDLSAVADIS